MKRKPHVESPDRESTRIAERVKFWSEQDRINQVLIPRFIRQSELLAKHIAEHDDLPQLLNEVVSEALSQQSKSFEQKMETLVIDLNNAHTRALELEESLTERTRQLESIKERLDRHERKVRNRLILGTIVACAFALIVAALA